MTKQAATTHPAPGAYRVRPYTLPDGRTAELVIWDGIVGYYGEPGVLGSVGYLLDDAARPLRAPAGWVGRIMYDIA